MRVQYLQCVKCRCRYSPGNAPSRCGCGGSIVIHYDWAGLKMSWRRLGRRSFNHQRYREFYPDLDAPIDLGEGGTPIIGSVDSPGWNFKIESHNPTGSVKDRGSAVEISWIKETGANKVVIASTGNSGASAAAYCARAGLGCEVVLPIHSSKDRVREIKSHGAKVSTVNGDYSKAVAQAIASSKKEKVALAGNYTFRREGEKSVAFELIDQLRDLEFIVVPVGDGSLISAIWRGCKDLYAARLSHRMPRLVGVQAQGCCPIVRAFVTDRPIKRVLPKTSADSISSGDPIDGDLAILSVQESQGGMVAVSEEEIAKARSRLARREGIEVEPAAAAVLAGALKLRIPKTAKTAFILSGSGAHSV